MVTGVTSSQHPVDAVYYQLSWLIIPESPNHNPRTVVERDLERQMQT